MGSAICDMGCGIWDVRFGICDFGFGVWDLGWEYKTFNIILGTLGTLARFRHLIERGMRKISI